jgi:hypothetical protein
MYTRWVRFDTSLFQRMTVNLVRKRVDFQSRLLASNELLSSKRFLVSGGIHHVGDPLARGPLGGSVVRSPDKSKREEYKMLVFCHFNSSVECSVG